MTFLLAAAMLAGTAGCGGGEGSGSVPTLNWYLRYDEQADQDKINVEVNKLTEQEIGCRVNIKRIENGDYEQKISLALASGEDVDICHMAPRYNFYSNVAKKAFMPLDDLLEQYGKETYEIMPEKFWDAAKIDGKIYGIPNYQIVGRMNGFVVMKSLLDKYNFDLSKVEKLEDMEPFYEAVKNGEDSNMKIFGSPAGAYAWGLMHYVGFDPVGSEKYPAAVRTSDDTLTVINQYESEEFENYCNLMREWYQKGYNPKQGSADSISDLKQQGLVASWVDNIAPGYLPNFQKQCNGREVDGKVIDPPFVNTQNVIATMNCIGAVSKKSDYAMKFINMVNTDKNGIYNLLCYGIEGVHYNKVGERRIEKIEDSGYDPSVSWEFGNNFNAYLIPGQEDDLWEETAQVNENAVVSNLLGFAFNTQPVATELAACDAVVSEYLETLTLGAVDPAVVLPEFRSKLKAADVDKVIAEAQKQIDEWKATK